MKYLFPRPRPLSGLPTLLAMLAGLIIVTAAHASSAGSPDPGSQQTLRAGEKYSWVVHDSDGNGGNATPSATTTVSHAPGGGGTAATLAAAVQNGRPVARATRPGLGPNAVVLVLGADFKRLAGKVVVPKPPRPKPPKPTRATRGLPAWDPRAC